MFKGQVLTIESVQTESSPEPFCEMSGCSDSSGAAALLGSARIQGPAQESRALEAPAQESSLLIHVLRTWISKEHFDEFPV
jgi:hypothetical protein